MLAAIKEGQLGFNVTKRLATSSSGSGPGQDWSSEYPDLRSFTYSRLTGPAVLPEYGPNAPISNFSYNFVGTTALRRPLPPGFKPTCTAGTAEGNGWQLSCQAQAAAQQQGLNYSDYLWSVNHYIGDVNITHVYDSGKNAEGCGRRLHGITHAAGSADGGAKPGTDIGTLSRSSVGDAPGLDLSAADVVAGVSKRVLVPGCTGVPDTGMPRVQVVPLSVCGRGAGLLTTQGITESIAAPANATHASLAHMLWACSGGAAAAPTLSAYLSAPPGSLLPRVQVLPVSADNLGHGDVCSGLLPDGVTRYDLSASCGDAELNALLLAAQAVAKSYSASLPIWTAPHLLMLLPQLSACTSWTIKATRRPYSTASRGHYVNFLQVSDPQQLPHLLYRAMLHNLDMPRADAWQQAGISGGGPASVGWQDPPVPGADPSDPLGAVYGGIDGGGGSGGAAGAGTGSAGYVCPAAMARRLYVQAGTDRESYGGWQYFTLNRTIVLRALLGRAVSMAGSGGGVAPAPAAELPEEYGPMLFISYRLRSSACPAPDCGLHPALSNKVLVHYHNPLVNDQVLLAAIQPRILEPTTTTPAALTPPLPLPAPLPPLAFSRGNITLDLPAMWAANEYFNATQLAPELASARMVIQALQPGAGSTSMEGSSNGGVNGVNVGVGVCIASMQKETSSDLTQKRALCSDALDNDCDGLLDGDDPDCDGL